jgi:glucan endo-1,3-alpha-glucosidase
MEVGLMGIRASAAIAALLALAAGPPREGPRYVFAHYMVCFATYGEGVENYKREIREAQAAGIDGFALNCGSWHNEPHYPRRTKQIYQAAQELGTGFKLFFSVDLGNPDFIVDMVGAYARHPSQFTFRDRVVVSTFSADGVPWKEKVFKPLKESGIEVFFVPYFYPKPATELPSYDVVVKHHERWADVVDGMFYFGAAGLPADLAASNAAYAKRMREVRKVSMASYTPTYWGHKQPGRRYYESQGGEGTERQWMSIIESRPDWVEIVTWNDFGESSYVCPIEDFQKTLSFLEPPPRHGHGGYLELSRHFIEWYKTGRRPAPKREGLFYFYRTHPKDAEAPGDKPVKDRHGPVEDVLYVTTLVNSAAELRVTTGGSAAAPVAVKPGLQHHRTPFRTGPQRFELWRDGRAAAAADGPPVLAEITHFSFITASGSAYVR